MQLLNFALYLEIAVSSTSGYMILSALHHRAAKQGLLSLIQIKLFETMLIITHFKVHAQLQGT